MKNYTTKLKAVLSLLLIFLFNFSFSQNNEKFNIEEFEVQLRQTNASSGIKSIKEDIIGKTIIIGAINFQTQKKKIY